MNLKNIKDSVLVLNAETLVREDRERLTIFLHHLKEIDCRRLYSALGYKSLFEMTVKHFSYSEDEAYRRISAMKLLKDLPQVEEKINEGKLTLTHLSLAQKHFRQETKIQSRKITLDQKMLLIDKISNTSVREAEKITFSLSSNPAIIKTDRIRVIGENNLEMKFAITGETQIKIDQLKGFLMHKYPNISLGELFDLLCDLGLKELNPVNSIATVSKKVAAPKKSCVKKSKAQIRKDVFLKANCKCEKCGSGFALELDHIHPKALGGQDVPENLRLLCRSCNQRAAIQIFGIEKMNRYIN